MRRQRFAGPNRRHSGARGTTALREQPIRICRSEKRCLQRRYRCGEIPLQFINEQSKLLVVHRTKYTQPFGVHFLDFCFLVFARYLPRNGPGNCYTNPNEPMPAECCCCSSTKTGPFSEGRAFFDTDSKFYKPINVVGKLNRNCGWPWARSVSGKISAHCDSPQLRSARTRSGRRLISQHCIKCSNTRATSPPKRVGSLVSSPSVQKLVGLRGSRLLDIREFRPAHLQRVESKRERRSNQSQRAGSARKSRVLAHDTGNSGRVHREMPGPRRNAARRCRRGDTFCHPPALPRGQAPLKCRTTALGGPENGPRRSSAGRLRVRASGCLPEAVREFLRRYRAELGAKQLTTGFVATASRSALHPWLDSGAGSERCSPRNNEEFDAPVKRRNNT